MAVVERKRNRPAQVVGAGGFRPPKIYTICAAARAGDWGKAIRLAPNNYIEAQNWLKTSGRGAVDVYF